jgi:hypothetical protein
MNTNTCTDTEQKRNINMIDNDIDNINTSDKSSKEHVLVKRRSKKIEHIIKDFTRPVSPTMDIDMDIDTDMNALHNNAKTKCKIPHCPKHHPVAKFNESKYLIKDIKCIRGKKIEN